MDRSRWDRLNDLFDAACALEPADRDAFLRAECGADTELYERALALLVADGELGGDPFGDRDPVARAVATAAHDWIQPMAIGTRVGPYVVRRELGRGGMGVVYLAERADGQFDQRVALKLIKRGMDSDEILRRFRTERQILARLEHPGIARLIDGGITDDGAPWFAMEYVEGEPIDVYCVSHSLDIDQRLALFQHVCDAVMYAHANLVVHRDLKPGNIMVTPAGEVRLLDFGVAHVLTDSGGALLTRTPATTGFRALTPEYASPEHVRGEAVGTAADVYSLGVILYELLTGVRPYEIASTSAVEIERIVTQTEPQRPSSRVGAAPAMRRVHRRLAGDLDVICLEALRKEPSRRYPSVEGFADDIRRHLAGMPVRARPDSLGYRVRKFVGRNRAGVAATAVVIVTISALVGYYTHRVATQRDIAELEAAKASQVSDFLRGLFEISDPWESQGEVVTARELLDAGAERIERELADQPEVQASMLRVIGDVYNSLGLYAQARPPLERSLSLNREHLGEQHEETAASESALAVLLREMGDWTAADSLERRALATRTRLFGRNDLRVASSLGQLATTADFRGDLETGVRLARESLEIERRLLPRDHPRITSSLAQLGDRLRRQRQFDQAEPILREALARQRAEHGDYGLAVATTARDLGALLRDSDRLEEADSLYRVALSIRREILGDEHPDVASTMNSYALLLDYMDEDDRAIEMFEQYLRMQRQVHGDTHPDIATVVYNLAMVHVEVGNHDAAIPLFREMMRIQEATLPAGHAAHAYPRYGIGVSLSSQGRFAEAEPLIRESVAIRRAALAPGHRYIGDSLLLLGTCLTGLRRYDAAERTLNEAREIMVAAVGAEDQRTKRVDAAIEALERARQ